MDLSAFQLFKNNSRTNRNAALHHTPLIDYGRVIRVIDIQTVVVETIIQTSLSKEVYTVTLLSLSSALLEVSDYPKLGDTVILFFLRKYDALMFMRDIVHNPDAAGYNVFSGVGILMSTAKNAAHTIIAHYEDDGKPVTEITSDAELYGTFNNLATITFCRAVFDSEDEALITVLFGKGRPLVERFLSRVERSHGFWKDAEGEWEEVDAKVTERYSVYAPITHDIQGSQTIREGLGVTKDDEPVETEAPITETVHGKAPIVRDIRSPQTVTVGIGNDESGDETEERSAPVHETYGSKAPITKDIRSPQTYTIGTGPNGTTHAPVNVKLDADSDIDLVSQSHYDVQFKRYMHHKITSGEKFKFYNLVDDMCAIIGDFMNTVNRMTTVGSAPRHRVSPVDKLKLSQLLRRWKSLME
jgi:hypothetical protein